MLFRSDWVRERADSARLLPPAKLELRMAGQPSRAEAMRLLKDMLTDLRRRLHGEDNPKIELDAALAQG